MQTLGGNADGHNLAASLALGPVLVFAENKWMGVLSLDIHMEIGVFSHSQYGQRVSLVFRAIK